MKFDQFDESHLCDEKAWLWWKFSKVLEIYHCDENKLMWRDKCTSEMKIYQFDTKLSIWWKLIVMEIYHCDENLWK